MLQTTFGTEVIDALNERAWELRSGEIAEPLALSHEALDLSQQTMYEKGIACSQRNLGYFYSRLCDFDAALNALLEGSKIAESLGDDALLSSIYNNLGILYMNQGKYPESLEIFKKNLTVIERTGNPAAKALTLNNIGNIYWALENFAEMLNAYFAALKAYETLNEESGMATIYNNIGNMYKILQDYGKARENYYKSFQLQERYGNLIGMAVAQTNLAMLHLIENDFSAAKTAYLEALATQQLLADDQQKARIYVGLGKSCKGLDCYDEALRHFHRALDISMEIQARELQVISLLELGTAYFEMEDFDNAEHFLNEVVLHFTDQRPESYLAYKTLSEICALRGDFKNAWQHHKSYHDGYETHKNEEAEERFKKLFMSFEVEKAQREKELYRRKSEELADALMELKVVYADFKKLSDVRNEMLGIVAHDLQNPLSGIMLWAELLEQQLHSGDTEHKIVHNILKSSRHMSAIIRELLDTGLEEAESAARNVVVLDAVTVARDVAEEQQKPAAFKNITIHHLLPDNLFVKTDPISLRRVIENLLSNAVKFSPQSSNVFLKLYKSGNELHMIVEDEGPGISAEDSRKLFKKFSRLSARPTGGEYSTGLGLYVVKLLVGKMDGTIHCESELGKGARFIVTIPIGDL
ncbi:MAG TPA: tetratricopeptide repeat-containing sensor histidine kinase [Patescibacteria group bacterium]|nr:tetratricopeptide repeat-containing sensor histidine kinase [Patescibacteria group bacterium]